MEQYKQTLKNRLTYSSLGLLVYLAANGMLYATLGFGGNDHSQGFLRGFHTGLSLALAALLVYFLVRYYQTLKDPEKLKRSYIKQTDERRLMIVQKSGSLGMSMVMVGLGSAAVFAGYFDMRVFFTLLGAYLLVAFVRVGLKMYYDWKY